MGPPPRWRAQENRAIESRQLAAAVARIAEEKKGRDIRVYDVSETLKVAEYFVLVTGTSRPHVKALYDEIHVVLKAAGERHGRAEGLDLGWWVVLDYADVVVHLLQAEARDYYALDHLYEDCPTLDWESVPLPALPVRRAGPAKLAE